MSDIAHFGEPERDPELEHALGHLDPAHDDPNYWMRFRGWVLSSAQLELARRRLAPPLTISDVVGAWARTLVPVAGVAAAAAALVLVTSQPADAPTPPALAEQLVSELPDESATLLLAPEGTEGIVAFAAEEF